MSVRPNFADIHLRGIRDVKRCISTRMPSGTELAREIQLTDWSTAREQGKLVLRFRLHHWRNLFHFSQREKIVFRLSKLYINCSIFTQRFLSRKNVEKKLILTKFFFVTSIQFVACALRENLSNRSSGVQIPSDICTRFRRYLYSTKCSWIVIRIFFRNLHEQ